MSEILMPSLADSMTEGTIVRWLKHDGDAIRPGDELAEIETEKATVSIAAEAEGYLQVTCPEGETVAVGSVIARIDREVGAPGSAPEPAPAGPPAPAGNGAAPPPEPAVPAAAASGVRATPLARLLAARHGVDVATVAGTGPRGRIRTVDVASRLDLPPPAAPAAEPAPAIEPPTRLQRTIARRMQDAAAVPTFQVQTEVELDRVLELRARLREEAGEEPVPSLNDFFVKASALALLEHPRANGSYREEGFVLHGRVNVGFAVAAADALIVPTVRDAAGLSLVALAAETRRLADAVRAGTVTPHDLADGTFTVSNLGMFGMTAIAPVLNPPQAAILGVGSSRETLALDDGEVVARQRATLTLTCDHRILYGADAARFLATIRELLERPLRLLW